MSEIKLNLIDAQGVFSGTLHGSVADAMVASLSAEPETFTELEAALARFIKPRTSFSLLANVTKRDGLDEDPWDSGVIIIDLASRTVAIESTYSQPGPHGEVKYHDGIHLTDVPIRYQLPDDWAFVYSVAEYKGISEQRKRAREANPPLDTRSVLYGRPLLEWIVKTIHSSHGAALWRRLAELRARLDASDQTIEPAALLSEAGSDDNTDTNPVSDIHTDWLMTPREDLCGQTPKEVLLAKTDYIDSDLESRALQWTFLGEGPPCLSVDSFAFRFAGFGTHEWVIYYDLVRHLIWSALLCQSLSPRGLEALKRGANYGELKSVEPISSASETRDENVPRTSVDPVDIESAIAQLEEIKTAWLERPQYDYDSRTPAILIGNERKRLPIALQPRDMIIDENCPTCQMFADESALGLGVGFWHLDGSNMDDDFAFSHFQTRDKWEAERREWAEFSEKFNREWEESQQGIVGTEFVERELGSAGKDPF